MSLGEAPAQSPAGRSAHSRSGGDLRAGTLQRLRYDRVIVAVGPTQRDIRRSRPFLAELADAGSFTLDTGADPTLLIAGPLARRGFGELMGLPQVSAFAQFVADRLAVTLNRLEPRERGLG